MSGPRLVIVLLLTVNVLAGADAAPTLTGQQVFERHCIHCHAPGFEHPGTRQLAVTRGENKAVLEERKDLSPDYVTHVVRHGLMSMPPFVPSDLTDERLRLLLDYLTARSGENRQH